MANIRPELFERQPAPGRPSVFRDAKRVAEITMSRPLGFVGRGPAFNALLSVHSEMSGELILKVSFVAVSEEKRSEAAEESSHKITVRRAA
jgi:hypothetical protein